MGSYVVLVFAALAVVIVAKLLAWPFKKILKLAINIICGIVLILLVNTFGVYIGITLELNILTALITGILGVPGVILLILINFLR